MENVEQEGSSEGTESVDQNSSGNMDQTGSENASETNNGENVEGESKTNAEKTEGEGDVETFVERDGKHWIPKERFDQINDRMKKAEEAATFLEAIKTDPIAKAEFVKALGLDKSETTETKADEPAPDAHFQEFLKASVDPQHHGHYNALGNAIMSTIQPAIMKEVNAIVKPIMAALGGMKLAEVQKSLPDFNKYQVQVAENMKRFPGMTPEEAYALASHKDTFKKGEIKGVASMKTQQGKVNKAPITKGNPGVGSQGSKGAPKTFREAFDAAYDKNRG